MFNLWGSAPSTPRRNSTLKPSPLSPKLTTNTSPEYPPHLAQHDTQWEHVKPGSPSSDEAAFESLGYTHVQVASSSSSSPESGGSPPPPATSQWQEERERLTQQLEAARSAQRKAESDRERWERKVVELRTNMRAERERERERDGSSAKSRRERDGKDANGSVVAIDALKEESERLKSMLLQQTQQRDAAREGMKQERAQFQSETERLKGERDAALGAHKTEVETLKISLQEHAQRVEYLTAERERVRKDRDTIRGNLSAEVERLKQTHAKETEGTRTALEELNRERIQAQAEAQKLRKSLDAYAPKLDASLHEIEALQSQLATAKESQRAATELRRRLEIQNDELRRAREESSTLRKEFDQLTTLLEDRTSELKGAQSFLTTADAFSGAEVTSTLQRLNAEVLQSTAFMAESMVELFSLRTPVEASKTDEQSAACKRASATVGSVIVHFLGTKTHTEDPILIQIAFQAYLTYRLCWIAGAWIIGGDENYNRFIDAIYKGVHEKEAQAIAGRWRALTRAHVPSTPLDDAQLAFQIASKMSSGLGDILLSAGCTASKSDVVSALCSRFADKLTFLVSLALRVNKIIGEDVTSGDFEVLAIPPGAAFDATTMEDSYDDGGIAKGKGIKTPKVLCATDLGLRKKTRVGMSGEKQWEIQDMLKPKVALEAVIDIMDE